MPAGMLERARNVADLAATSAYLLGAAAYLRLSRQVRPDRSLLWLIRRAVRLRVSRALGLARSGPVTDIGPHVAHAYLAALPRYLGAPSDTDGGSRLRLLEDGRPLGPAHSEVRDIEAFGAGRFIHWNDCVFFSTSDNSDPRTNGRRYTYDVPSEAG